MSRFPPWLLVVAVSAAIYLPALGSFEIKSEEGRRILPGIAMLESGEYIVPQIGGRPYFSKPPLVNWLVAASFKLFRFRNEWTARLPSVLCILAVAIALITVGRTSLGRSGSTIGALIWLTTVGIIEKGRLIEIEALYVSLCALAMIFWLTWWEQKRSPWLTWIVPWLFLGLGWLAKGPVLLIFFYIMIVAVVWRSKRWKELIHPAHFLGVILMLAIFAAWAIPFIKLSGQSRTMTKWANQFLGRTAPESFHFRVWILGIPRAIGQFLPWVLFLPILRFDKFRDENQQRLARSLMWSFVVPLAGVSLLPGSAPRYSLPVAAPFCWLMALAFSEDAFAPPRWLSRPGRSLWLRLGPAIVIIVTTVCLVGYPLAAVFNGKRSKVKSVAEQLNAVIPQDETLYAVDPGYQPALFYVRARLIYLDRIEDIPPRARYFLVRPDNEQLALLSNHWSPGRARLALRVTDYRQETVILFDVKPPS
ncbi:MAG: hypothetical protein QOG67_577 [Verrucomicrobiota bacterium]|jgi:4-amino-4-deoxy-L-arabinose transferase-like glycosyltransferase